MLIRTVLHVSLCMLLAQHITGELKNIDGLQNEDIVLCPTFSGELEDITWKLGNNKIAEYDSFKTTTYYGDFKKETELNITSGCLKMNNIIDRRDGLYTAELQIGGQLQYHEFKLKVYRPVSKPNITCSVTDSVTLLCEGDESLGDQYRWEAHENQVRRGTTNGKNLTFSKEENHNTEYTCIFSNLKSEERSDPIKNCFVPGGRSHILVLILVLLAVLAGLIVWGYKCYSKSQVGGKHVDSMAGHKQDKDTDDTGKLKDLLQYEHENKDTKDTDDTGKLKDLLQYEHEDKDTDDTGKLKDLLQYEHEDKDTKDTDDTGESKDLLQYEHENKDTKDTDDTGESKDLLPNEHDENKNDVTLL